MNLVQFIENRFQELTVELQVKYVASKDAELKALHAVMNAYRTVLKWLKIPQVLFDFMLVRLEFAPEPKAPLLEKLKREQKQREEEGKRNAEASSKEAEVIPLNSSTLPPA